MIIFSLGSLTWPHFWTRCFEPSVQMYNDDPEAIYAVIAMVLSSFFLQANVYVTLRMLKGMQFTTTYSGAPK